MEKKIVIKKKLIEIVLIFSMVVTLVSCDNSSENTTSNSTKLAVSVTFNAMAEFVTEVAKDKVEITTLIPNGMEPHDFEPKAADIAKLSNAKLFVYNGLGMESWVEDAINAVDNDSLVVVNASDHSNPIKNSSNKESDNQGGYDPHLWLSIKGAEIEVQNIAEGLSAVDPDNKEFYEANAAEYISQLEDLFNEYNNKFSTLSNKNFVTGHAAFQYFCQDFGLEQNSVEDVFAEGEPSTKQLGELVDYCKEHNVSTIFAEDLASPKISQTLANEVGADVKTIHTMESAEDEMTYLERMKENCEEIYISLNK